MKLKITPISVGITIFTTFTAWVSMFRLESHATTYRGVHSTENAESENIRGGTNSRWLPGSGQVLHYPALPVLL